MKSLFRALGILTAVAGSFAIGFTWKDIRADGIGSVAGSLKQQANPASTVTPTQLFTGEYRRILSNYHRTANPNQLLYSGMDGLLSALGDPHTQFFEPYINQEFERSTMGQQSFGGVGARLSADPLGVKVIQVFRDGPAAKAGVRAGDIIIGVGKEEVAGQSSDEIVNKIKGKINTPVSLRIFRGGKDTLDFSINRGRIVPPSADGNVIEGTNIGYILVTGFEQPTPRQFYAAVRDLESKGIEGLVIDLRDNGGGLLESAVEMLARYAEMKTVVTMHERGNKKDTVRTPAGLLHDWKYPTTILMNERSASASEIFAGVLRDYKLATLVGEHTYGKASVQNVIPLSGKTSVKITVANYALPSGDDISRKVDQDGQYISGGLKPDVKVAMSLEPDVALGDLKTDNQLQEAVKIIRQKNPKAR